MAADNIESVAHHGLTPYAQAPTAPAGTVVCDGGGTVGYSTTTIVVVRTLIRVVSEPTLVLVNSATAVVMVVSEVWLLPVVGD